MQYFNLRFLLSNICGTYWLYGYFPLDRRSSHVFTKYVQQTFFINKNYLYDSTPVFCSLNTSANKRLSTGVGKAPMYAILHYLEFICSRDKLSRSLTNFKHASIFGHCNNIVTGIFSQGEY